MQDRPAAAEPPWYAVTVEAAVERCGSSARGLASAEAAERLKANGPNRLAAGKTRSLAARLFAHINNLLIYVLVASALILAFVPVMLSSTDRVTRMTSLRCSASAHCSSTW